MVSTLVKGFITPTILPVGGLVYCSVRSDQSVRYVARTLHIQLSRGDSSERGAHKWMIVLDDCMDSISEEAGTSVYAELAGKCKLHQQRANYLANV